MVNWENYEEYMLLLADGELDEAGKAALNIFLAKHPELKKELATYQATRLAPDMDVVYQDKTSLQKKEVAKTISFRNWWAYSAAAGVAILIGFLVMTDRSNKVEFAHNDKPDTVIAKPATSNQQPVVNQQTIATINEHPATNIKHQASSNQQQTHKTRTQDQIASIPTASMNSAIANKAVANPENNKTEMPIVTAAQAETKDKKFLAWLPIAEEKKQGLSDLKDAVDNTIQKARSIKETAVVVKLGNRNLLTINL